VPVSSGRSIRVGLLGEILAMAFDTIRSNKARSGLTVLGVVIGITAIVGMTSLIRGFDQSVGSLIREMGPETIILAKFSGVSFAAGKEFTELIRRPNLSVEDARAVERNAPSVQLVDIWLGAGGPPTQEKIFYRGESSKTVPIVGATENYAAINWVPVAAGRIFNTAEVRHRHTVVVLGQGPAKSLFPNSDPLGKEVRIGGQPYTVIGVLGPRPSPGGFNLGQDEFAVIPHSTYQKQFGIRAFRSERGEHRSIIIVAAPYPGMRDQALKEVEQIMRIRHGLRLDQPNDFDLVTSEAAQRVWKQFTQATFLALVVISSIALMVGGIGVMAIMMISVTDRTREIGLRKALGARRREILWQFLAEAVALTSTGGVLGILLGSAIGFTVHFVFKFPISLPWWSFALGIGFSATVGIAFGMVPAIKASRLDPIEALRYE